MNQEKIGQVIKEIRTKNNLSQQAFAEKFGVTYQAVSKWENGKNIPDIATLKEICKEYNLKLEIKDNEFIYTTPDEKAELLIKVIDPNGEELTEIPGLEYVESQGYKGFDITTKNGDFYIAQNYEISTNSLVVHNWKVEVTLVNLDTNQYMNIGNDFNGVLKMESVRGNG